MEDERALSEGERVGYEPLQEGSGLVDCVGDGEPAGEVDSDRRREGTACAVEWAAGDSG